MKLKEKFDSIDQSKLNADQKDFLSKIEKATKNFTSDNKEVNDKVEGALDKMIATFKEKMPEAIKAKAEKKEPKASAKKATAKPSQTSSQKRTVMSVAKEIRKDGESWADAQKRARAEMKKDKDSATKEVKTEMDKLLAFIKTRKELDGISGTDLKRDSSREAKPRGRRISKDGNVYYENRENRIDRLAPNYPKDAPLLENGGGVNNKFYDIFASKKNGFDLYEINGNEDFFVGNYESTEEAKEVAEKLGLQKRPMYMRYAKGGMLSPRERYNLEIKGMTGVSVGAIEKYIDENNLNDNDILNIVVGLGRKQLNGADVSTAMVGKKGNAESKKLIRFVKDDKAMKLELGGNVGGYDLAGHLDGTFNVGQDDGALSGVSGTSYSGLVGETGAMSSGEMFMNGGGIPQSSQHSYMVVDSFGNPAQHYELGGTVVTDLAGHTGGGSGGLNADMPLSGFSNTSYSGLVGETGAMSSGEMFAEGGYLTDPTFGQFQAGVYAEGGSLENHGIKEGDTFIKTISGVIQKVKDKDGKIVFINLATGERDSQPPLPFKNGGDIEKEKLERRLKFVNEDAERIFKNAPKSFLDYPVKDWENIGTILSNIEIASNLKDNESDDWKSAKFSGLNSKEKLERRLKFVNEDAERIFKNAPKSFLDYPVKDWENIGTILSNIEIASNLKDNESDDWKYDDGGEVTYFVNKDGIRVRSKVEPKNRPTEKEWMAKNNESREARAYADGGDIEAFSMRMVKGSSASPTEVLTEEKEVKFAKGGSLREKRNDYLSKLGDKEADVWDKVGANSGTKIRGDKKMLKAYAEGVEEMLIEENVQGRSFDQEDYDFYTDQNWHLFNDFLVWNGYYKPEMTVVEKKWREKAFKEGNIYVSDPEVIFVKGLSSYDKKGYVQVVKTASRKYVVELKTNAGDWKQFNDTWNLDELEKAEKFAKRIAENNKVKYEGVDTTPYEAIHGKSKNYIVHADIKSVTVNQKGMKYTFKGSDVLNGANILEKGNVLETKAIYIPKRDVISIELKDGSEVKPSNGYWIKKDASGELFKPESEKVESKSKQGDLSSFEQKVKDALKVENKWHFISEEVGGKEVQLKMYVGKKEVDVQIFKINNISARMPKNYAGKRETLKMIMDNFKSDFETGGKVPFAQKSKAIAKNFEGKPVEPKYQKEYGKTYDGKEAKEVGDKIAGAQKASYDAKAEKGAVVKRKSGNPKMKEAMVLAKKIRKDGEKWTDAVKRAYAQVK